MVEEGEVVIEKRMTEKIIEDEIEEERMMVVMKTIEVILKTMVMMKLKTIM